MNKWEYNYIQWIFSLSYYYALCLDILAELINYLALFDKYTWSSDMWVDLMLVVQQMNGSSVIASVNNPCGPSGLWDVNSPSPLLAVFFPHSHHIMLNVSLEFFYCLLMGNSISKLHIYPYIPLRMDREMLASGGSTSHHHRASKVRAAIIIQTHTDTVDLE